MIAHGSRDGAGKFVPSPRSYAHIPSDSDSTIEGPLSYPPFGPPPPLGSADCEAYLIFAQGISSVDRATIVFSWLLPRARYQRLSSGLQTSSSCIRCMQS